MVTEQSVTGRANPDRTALVLQQSHTFCVGSVLKGATIQQLAVSITGKQVCSRNQPDRVGMRGSHTLHTVQAGDALKCSVPEVTNLASLGQPDVSRPVAAQRMENSRRKRHEDRKASQEEQTHQHEDRKESAVDGC